MELRSRRVSGEADAELGHAQNGSSVKNRGVLQTFYYGLVEGKTEISHGKYEGQLRCGCCLKRFKTSQEIMLHCFGHVKYTEVPGDPVHPQASCNYCLNYYATQSNLDAHIQEVHTLSNDRFCCRICQEWFPNKGNLISHMWKLHVEAEIPYICELCGFSSSMHTDVIDHFHKEHGSSDYVLCPFCLKTLTVRSEICITQIYVHLQSHRLIRNKRCRKCQLMFITDDERQTHTSFAHKRRSPHEIVRYVMSAFEEVIEMPIRRAAHLFCNQNDISPSRI